MRCPCLRPSVLVVACAIALAPAAFGDDRGGAALTAPLPAPVFSPFGDRVAAAIGSEGTGAVVVVELAGDKPVARTVSRRGVDPHSSRPRFSPDGNRVAWTVGAAAMLTSATKEGAEVEKRSLSRTPKELDPTSDWAVVTGGVYSPDGVRLAYVIPRGEGTGTYVAPVVGGKVTRITKLAASHIAWSANGKRLALSLPKHDIVVVGADGNGEKAITPTPADGALALRFGEDGKSLLVFADGKLSLWDLASGKATGEPESLLAADQGTAVAASWSPTEEILAIVTDAGTLGLVKLGGKGAFVQVSGENDRVLSEAGWSPDGARVGTVEFGGKGEVALVSYEVISGKIRRVPLFWNPSGPRKAD